MITAIIVDDEKYAREDLKKMLEAYYNDIKIVAACCDISEAEQAISTFHPELVFLDVELGTNQTSFDLLKKIKPIYFDIIFTTAHNKYALQAIKSSAIDYLLKPVDDEELRLAIEKFKNRKSKVDANKVDSLLSAWNNPGNQINKISLPTMNGYDLIPIAEIVSCEGIRNQTLIVLTDKNEVLISKILKECEELLVSYNFLRIHKSYLINLNHVKRFIKGKDGSVVMSNGKTFTVSRNFKDDFIKKIKIP